MARSNTRYSIYPAPKAVEVVGSTAPELNQAIECWAALLARAVADNSKKFSPAYTGQYGEVFDLDEWSLLAHVLSGVHFDPEFANPGQLVATAIEDAHRLEDIALKYFEYETDLDQSALDAFGAQFHELLQKLQELDYAHAWALITTIRWFWDHHAEIDPKSDKWWTLSFRRERSKGSDKSPAASADAQQSKQGRKAKRSGKLQTGQSEKK